MARARRLSGAAGAFALLLTSFWAARASAQGTIRAPGDRPPYVLELEPHFLVGPFGPPGPATGQGLGLGFRGTVEILRDGFIGPINDSIGIGVGADYLRYGSDTGPRGSCERFETGPGGTRICVEVDPGGGEVDYLFLPVVMQWNFWLHRRWSVFGEPGLALYFTDFDELHFQPFVIYAGGRFHVSNAFALTLRLGYPTFSIGASFFL